MVPVETWYEWVQNLVGFFLFMAVIDNLLPGKNYQKYVRLFAGTVLILLVLKPLTGSLRLEEAITRAYESFMFQYQADDLQEELLGIETRRLEQMISRYEEAVAADVEQMAAEEQLAVRDCQVTIDGEAQSENYGQVVRIQVTVTAAGEEKAELVEPVAPVVIGGSGAEPESKTSSESEAEPGNCASELSGCVLRLRRRMETYYDLEERYVEIQIAQG